MRSSIIVAAMICAVGPAVAQSSDTAKTREIQSTTQPVQQKDLDTFKLASAHREKADSIQEKTNGLWQSWLVSICEGCGPERQPYFKRSRVQVVEKEKRDTVSAQRPTITDSKTVVSKPQKSIASASLVADLSSRNIEQIRRMPR